jgi:hypothetical protein
VANQLSTKSIEIGFIETPRTTRIIFIGLAVTLFILLPKITLAEIQMKVNQPLTFQSKVIAGSTVTEINFSVPTIPEGRLQIQLRTTIVGAKVSLINPSGKTVVPDNDPRIVFQDRAILQEPIYGDLVMLPEQIDPAGGSWVLRLVHHPASDSVKVTLTTTLFERYVLNLISSKQIANVGQEVLLTILATDYGKPIVGLSPKVEVRRNGDVLGDFLTASEGLMSQSGIRLSNEGGIYLSRYALPTIGTYQFLTQASLQGRQGKIFKEANTTVSVGASSIQIVKLDAKPVRVNNDCVKTIEFLLELAVKDPGTYSVSLYFKGHDDQDFELSATQEAKGDEILTFHIPLQAIDALKKINAQAIISVKNINVLRFNSESIDLLGSFSNPTINSLISIQDLCSYSP